MVSSKKSKKVPSSRQGMKKCLCPMLRNANVSSDAFEKMTQNGRRFSLCSILTSKPQEKIKDTCA